MAPSDQETLAPSPLREADLADAEALVRESGWNQVAADWRAFLDLGSVYAIRTPSGRVIATAATLPYGGRFAWISMVLVAGAYRRRGLATLLLRRCVDDLTARGLVPVLDATPAGRAVYVGLGFEDSWSFQRYARGDASGPARERVMPSGVTLAPISDDTWPRLCAYDAAVFGADRSGLLARLRGRAPAFECVAERDGEIVGAMLGRDGRVATQIGPIVAEDDACAGALLARALSAVPGPVFIDVPDSKGALIGQLTAAGFAAQRPLTRMLHRRNAAFDDGRRTYAVVGPEFG
ncbi:MAG TPA: GNAT family N-acetyltransferase [Xanthobacteraceae bacterium]|nr:GNAT family N-acetyltransferase [Xanthobacteraceae bacterium]